METKGIDFSAIPQTAVKVLTTPATFFREMPKSGGFLEPLVFMIIMGLVSGLLRTLFGIFHFHMAAGMTMGVISIVLIPIVVAIFGFIAAGIVYLIWKIMGSGEEYETAYRCIAYIGALAPINAVLSLIPYVGGAFGIFLSTYFLVIASTEVHKIEAKKAWLVFGVIAAVLAIVNVSGQIAARRMADNMKGAAKSWNNAAEEARKAAIEMQEQLKKKLPPNESQ